MTVPNPDPLTHDGYRALLAEGGLTLPAPGDGEAGPLPKYSGSRDPAGAERLGAALAEAVAAVGTPRPDLVVVWQDPEDLVLGHVVARELGTAVVRFVDLDGLVGHEGSLPRNASAVVVTDAVRDPAVVRAIAAVLDRAGGSVVAVAGLVAPAFDLAPIPAVTARPGASVVTA